MAHSTVISFRVPLEFREEIIMEAVMHDLSITEYIILQLRLVRILDSNVENIIEDVANCKNYCCPLAAKFKELSDKLNSDLE